MSQFTVDVIEKLPHLLSFKPIYASSCRYHLSILDYYFPVTTGFKAWRLEEQNIFVLRFSQYIVITKKP